MIKFLSDAAKKVLLGRSHGCFQGARSRASAQETESNRKNLGKLDDDESIYTYAYDAYVSIGE